MEYLKPIGISLALAASISMGALADDSGVQISSYQAVVTDGEYAAQDIVQLGFTQPMAGGTFSFSSSRGEQDTATHFSYRGKRNSVALFNGRGERYSQLNQGHIDIDPFFFHGGSFTRFSYDAIATEMAVTDAFNVQIGGSRLSSDGLDQRSAWYAGIGTANNQFGIMTGYRDNDPTASGFSYSHWGKNSETRFQQLEHESGARYRSLSFETDLKDNRWYRLSYSSGRNPLHISDNEDRVMLQLGGLFGRHPLRMNADEAVEPVDETVESDGTEEAPVKKSRGGAVLVGATVIGFAAASSSGDDNRDNSARYNRQHDAAQEVLNTINPVSVRQNREHGGWIYRNGDGSYGYTTPVAGTIDSVNIGNPFQVIPRGTQETATYHTHGGNDPRYDNENFSTQDLLSDAVWGVDGYLGTPLGKFKYHNVRTGVVSTIGRVATQ